MVATVEVSPSAQTLTAAGATQQFSAVAKDAMGAAIADVTLLWVSSNQSVAIVDTSGLATARGPGATVITAAARGVPGHATLTVAVEMFAAVSAGDRHTCGLTTSGNAYCWGLNEDGQLGDGTTTDKWTPVAVSGGLSFVAVSAGGGLYEGHSCGLATDGSAYCWGNNTNGQLGDGTWGGDRLTPVAVSGGLSFVEVSAGGEMHTCGVTDDGSAYCWGNNEWGQLGVGGSPWGSNLPWAVSGGLRFAAVSAGAFYTCGVTDDGSAYCWGENWYGQLGDGSPTASRLTPVAVLGGLRFAAVSAGKAHSCGLTSAGKAYCWGSNGAGQLGDGTTTNRLTPVAVYGGPYGGLSFATLSAGSSHNCGLTTGGSAYCWGNNSYGQRGDGTMTSSSIPAAVLGALRFAAVSLGTGHSCGVTTGGSVYCWGFNLWGQLGDGTTSNSYIPVRVSLP